MDVFFVDLCSFMLVSETLYSREKRHRYLHQNQATVEELSLVINLKIDGREEQFNWKLFV